MLRLAPIVAAATAAPASVAPSDALDLAIALLGDADTDDSSNQDHEANDSSPLLPSEGQAVAKAEAFDLYDDRLPQVATALRSVDDSEESDSIADDELFSRIGSL